MIQDFVYQLKYARYDREKRRREVWSESVARYMRMLRARFPEEPLSEIESAIQRKEILPSMRGLQFGGLAITEKNMRIYNCTSSYADRPRFFSEALWLLLCGAGVGYSVQRHHVANLPPVSDPFDVISPPSVFVVPDSIEGWAESVNELINAYLLGAPLPDFDFSQIRPLGAPLRHGGTAPSSAPLERALSGVESILRARIGQKLRPLDVFDMVCHLANCTVTAGTRRSATIAQFSADDEEMFSAKTGDWFDHDPQRARANISAVILPESTEADFERCISATREFGEPAFLFLASPEITTNPCVEIAMCPVLIRDPEGAIVEHYTLDLLDFSQRPTHLDAGYTFASGWQACNLSTINMATARRDSEFLRRAELCARLGTYQASFTDAGYLGEVSEQILKREALLGVSLCGMAENEELSLNPDILARGAMLAGRINEQTAKRIGTRPASRITCVKPEGTASLVLGVSSGIHPPHAERYIRRVQCAKEEPIFRAFQARNPHAVEPSVWGADYCVAFAMRGRGTTRAQISAIEMLERVKLAVSAWCRYGTRYARVEGAHHNVSCTVSVHPHEWELVKTFLWRHRQNFTGVSLLSATGDYDYPQAPLQAISDDPQTKQEREALEMWKRLDAQARAVNWAEVREEKDATKILETLACAGGACELT